MTLVIAGYDYSESWFPTFEEDSPAAVPKMDVNGLFIVADSAITKPPDQTLLNGFRKIHPIEAKVWKPNFIYNDTFNGYVEAYETRKLFIGFAGSTLVAQHVINNITEHLNNLRISFSRDENGFIKYNIIKHCDANPLIKPYVTSWSNDTFLDKDFKGLLTGEFIANVIEHSTNNALSSLPLTLVDDNANTELVAGIWCPCNDRHELYTYQILNKKDNDGILVFLY